MTFRNRNNEHFSWDDDDDEPVVVDNAVEPEVPTAPFPYMTNKLLGIPLESDTPVPAVNAKEPPGEASAWRAAANANFGPNIIPSDAKDDRNGFPGVQPQINNNFIYNNNAIATTPMELLMMMKMRCRT